MHFWISKPAGRYYSGNRYPATTMHKTLNSNHPYNSSNRRTRQVTPIRRVYYHGTSSAGPSRPHMYSVPQPLARTVHENNLPEEPTQHTQPNNIPNNVTNAGNNQQILSNVATNGRIEVRNRSVLDFLEVEDGEVTVLRSCTAVLGVCIFIAGYIALMKLRLEITTHDILVLCGLFMLLLTVCLWVIMYHVTRVTWRREHRGSQDHIISLAAPNTLVNQNVTLIPVVRQNPPPPYHIAILSPPSNPIDEAPPPSYDKIMQ